MSAYEKLTIDMNTAMIIHGIENGFAMISDSFVTDASAPGANIFVRSGIAVKITIFKNATIPMVI